MLSSKTVKIQVFCPKESADAVRLAIGEAGGGKIGNYSHCAFVTAGHGYFLPLDGSNPTIGNPGNMERVEECKIEFLCEEQKVSTVIAAVKKVHPYEEVPIDIFPMLNIA